MNSGILTEDEQDQMDERKEMSKYTKEEVILINFYNKIFTGLIVSLVILTLVCLVYRKFSRKNGGRSRSNSQRSLHEFSSATTKGTGTVRVPTRKPQKLRDEYDSDYVDEDKVLEP